MALLCGKCGKKIGILSNDPLRLPGDIALCYDCARPISDEMNDLLALKTSAEFDLLKNKILNKSSDIYDDVVVDGIKKRIEKIYEFTGVLYQGQKNEKKELIDNHMLTTGYDFNGYEIEKYLGVISGQVVLGTGFLSEFTASFADFFGEESIHFADKLETAKNAAMEKLIMKSVEKGGNSIIGVDFDYITFHANMIGVVANGTSVFVSKKENEIE